MIDTIVDLNHDNAIDFQKAKDSGIQPSYTKQAKAMASGIHGIAPGATPR
jgi:hypothetical protein